MSAGPLEGIKTGGCAARVVQFMPQPRVKRCLTPIGALRIDPSDEASARAPQSACGAMGADSGRGAAKPARIGVTRKPQGVRSPLAAHSITPAPNGLHSVIRAATAGRKFPAIAFRSRNVLARAAIRTWANSENDSGLTRCPPVSAGGTP